MTVGVEETLSRTPGMAVLRHVDLSETEARALTEKIKASMGDVMTQVAKAHIGRVWVALGYGSWADYIKGEFNHAPLSLPREERKAVVALLRGQGMSTRAIGVATGVDQKTVSNDLRPREENSSPITGLDGKSYQSNRPEPKPKRKPNSEPQEPWRMFMEPCFATSLRETVELMHDDTTARMFGAEVAQRNRFRAEMVDALRRAADTLEATNSHHRPQVPTSKGANE